MSAGREAPYTETGRAWSPPQKVAYSKGMTTGLPARVAICAVILTAQAQPLRADRRAAGPAGAVRDGSRRPQRGDPRAPSGRGDRSLRGRSGPVAVGRVVRGHLRDRHDDGPEQAGLRYLPERSVGRRGCRRDRQREDRANRGHGRPRPSQFRRRRRRGEERSRVPREGHAIDRGPDDVRGSVVPRRGGRARPGQGAGREPRARADPSARSGAPALGCAVAAEHDRRRTSARANPSRSSSRSRSRSIPPRSRRARLAMLECGSTSSIAVRSDRSTASRSAITSSRSSVPTILTTGTPKRIDHPTTVPLKPIDATPDVQVKRARLALSRAQAQHDDAARAAAMKQLATLLGVGDAVMISKRPDGALQWETWRDRAPGFSAPQAYTTDQKPDDILEGLGPLHSRRRRGSSVHRSASCRSRSTRLGIASAGSRRRSRPASSP